ncbi:MAG: hypothetical protein AMXMBFR13_43850 [Phycisphaerae bacterium]
MAESLPYPRMRAVEAFPIDQNGQQWIVLHDPSGLAAGPITLSPAALFVLSLLDGRRGPDELSAAFARQFGEALPREHIEGLIEQLDATWYLDSPAFAERFRTLVAEYRSAPARMCSSPGACGVESDDTATQAEEIRRTLARVLAGAQAAKGPSTDRRLTGLIAPHLDFGRGAPCYADAYAALAGAGAAGRFVVLGTNHFGRGGSVVATRKDFETPLGRTRTDRRFLEALEAGCGVDLCVHEFDHAREHSIELQVLMLQYLFGAESFQIVPVLCPDVCGPTGTRPRNGDGVDVKRFAEVLGDLIRSDETATVIVAGADLSHVGSRFGDDCELGPTFLDDVERQDRQALEDVVAGMGSGFVETLTRHENSTRVCSAGCIYTLISALDGAEGELLRYHQAVDVPNGTCVTCCAAAFWQPSAP